MTEIKSRCIVCSHPDRLEIDKALLAGSKTYREIEAEYKISRSAISRHVQKGHISAQVAKAHEAKQVSEACSLLEQVQDLQSTANRILKDAESKKDLRGACQAIREVRSILELLAKMTGELQGEGVTVNIVENPQFIEFKSVVMGVMCPECREQLRQRLAEIAGK
jgi:DNA-binding transcriptional ArsR family regulator